VGQLVRNYPIARNLNEFLATFYFLQLLWVYAGCNGAASIRTCGSSGAASIHTWAVVVQGTYIFKNSVFKKSCSVMAWKK
jgi:hypothetical protein